MNYYIFDYKSGRIEIVTKQDLKEIILKYQFIEAYLVQNHKAMFVSKIRAIIFQDIWHKRQAYHQNKI